MLDVAAVLVDLLVEMPTALLVQGEPADALGRIAQESAQGEITPPCGVPSSGYDNAPDSSTPAFNHFPIRRSNTPSRTP